MPVENSLIRLSQSCLSIDEIIRVSRVLDEGYLGAGEVTLEFEHSLQLFLNTDVVTVNSGTTALILALQVADVKPGDTVIVPSFTYVASVQSITAIGAKPFFVDIDKNGHLDVAKIPEYVLKKARAIMPVHFAGEEMNLSSLFNLAHKHSIRVVEDAAHSFGSQNIAKLCDREYDLVCYSFDGIKNITTGEGGAIVPFRKEDKDRLSDIRLLGVKKDFGRRVVNQRTWLPEVTEQGWRAHLSNINAAIGIGQLNRRTELWSRRKDLAAIYTETLSRYGDKISLILSGNKDVVPHIFPVRIPKEKRLVLESALAENNVQYGRHYYPNHRLAFFYDCGCGDLSMTETLYDEILTLPLHPLLKNSEAVDIGELVVRAVCR